jgi:predicted MFS family arabinose efflux permease
VTPAAASLFPPRARGRAIAVLYGGSSAGPLIGVPAGTWLGQQFGWRVPFLALSVVGLLIAGVVVSLMPGIAPGESHADRGSEPDRVRYRTLIVATAVTVTGVFTAITIITPFLTDVSGVPSSAIAVILLIRGMAGMSGVVVAGFLPDRHTWRALVALTALETVALALQGLWATHAGAAVVAVAAGSFALSGLVTVNGTRVLQVAPAGTDLASAAVSTAFNVGITAGALIGSLMLTTNLRAAPLVAAAFALGGVITLLAEPRLAAHAAREDPERVGVG